MSKSNAHCFSAIKVEHAAVDRRQHLRVVVAQVLPVGRADHTHVSVAVRVLRAGLVGRGQVEMLVQAAQAFELRVLRDGRVRRAYAGSLAISGFTVCVVNIALLLVIRLKSLNAIPVDAIFCKRLVYYFPSWSRFWIVSKSTLLRRYTLLLSFCYRSHLFA